MMKLSAVGTLVAASAAAAVIGLGAPAFASAGHVADHAKTTCYCDNGSGGGATGNATGGGSGTGGYYGHYGYSIEHRHGLTGFLEQLTDAILGVV
ncbi:MAG TPA: hypothetical protein VKD26_04325 [Streptosporangiaceae bacterium]|nr:hypothetical protein [Streptosporangiaceae bacterium]